LPFPRRPRRSGVRDPSISALPQSSPASEGGGTGQGRRRVCEAFATGSEPNRIVNHSPVENRESKSRRRSEVNPVRASCSLVNALAGRKDRHHRHAPAAHAICCAHGETPAATATGILSSVSVHRIPHPSEPPRRVERSTNDSPSSSLAVSTGPIPAGDPRQRQTADSRSDHGDSASPCQSPPPAQT
jgi:hypothetical protein